MQALRQLKVTEDDIDLMQSLVDRLQQNRVPVCGLLKQISILTPRAVVLSGLSLDQEKRSVTLSGSVQAISGTEEAILTDFMRIMEQSPFFGESSLVFSQNDNGTQTFEIKCDVTY